MCGITGIHGKADGAAWAAAHRMTAALAHRGPDAEGHWTDDTHVVLGHRRLSILDTSEAANQPMTSWCGRYVLAFNGEVYNYRELQEELDYPFQTTGDTEVVLAALRHWGASALERFNGMFALALWDTEEERLLLARDRMGIKPLYLFASDEGLMWASEIRALLASDRVPRRLDRNGLVDFLQYQTVHGPGTLVAGVESLPAGHLLWADDNEVRTEVWWDAATAGESLARLGEPWTYGKKPAAQRVQDLLIDSIALRMRSDVPFGAFLSGGIDSSAVVALMSEVSERPVSTFNVAFEEDAFDESRYARLMAQQCGTDHHEVRLRASDFLDAIPDALAATDHPSGDGPNTFVVSQATKQAGLTVALSGLGGDELFAGYPVFRRTLDLMDRQWAMAWPKGLRKLVGWGYQKTHPGVAGRKLAALLAGDRLDPASTYPISRRVLLDADVAALFPSAPSLDRVAQWTRSALQEQPGRALPPLSQVSLAELHTYLQHVLLRDTDQMSMAHALEVRVPFLDHRLVETALAIGDTVKFPHTPKALLTEALGTRLPREIIDRPKMGFTLPWEIWMRGPLASLCQAGLHTLADRELLDPAGLDRLWDDFEAGRTTWSRIWGLVALGQWIERHDLQ